MKRQIKEIEKKLQQHKKKPTLSDDEFWEISDRLTELTEMLKNSS